MDRIVRSVVLTVTLLTGESAWSQQTRPNIVYIMADDLGNAGLGDRGGNIKTPNIDKLATEGVRLESFYGQPVCTPARTALMTGRYPMRYGLQTVVIFPSHTYGLPTDERTLPQALKDVGYKTLMVGKRHLGTPIRSSGRRIAASIISTGTSSAKSTTSRASEAASSTGSATVRFSKKADITRSSLATTRSNSLMSRTGSSRSSSTLRRWRLMLPTRRRTITSDSMFLRRTKSGARTPE